VQYDESVFHYLHRLLTQAGIYYYFTQHQGRTVMVFTDNPAPHAVSSGQLTLLNMQTHQGITLSQTTSQRNDFKNPSSMIHSQQRSEALAVSYPTLETYHYGHHHPDDNQYQLDAHNKRRGQASQLMSQYQLATSHSLQLQAGSRFSLTEQTDTSQNGDYYVAAIVHHVIDNGASDSPQQKSTPPYENTVIAYQKHQSFVPEARLVEHHPLDNRYQQCRLADQPAFTLLPITEPHISGLHTATVVGPKDTPIYTDKYGRLKVQFDWDVHGEHDENSFAWVRCAQTWAGDGYGFHTIPRVGQAVLVSFDHGMPDKPIIVGPVPNDTTLPPFAPDSTPTQTGLQSKSLDSNAPTPAGHQVVFEDNAKQPFVKLHAQRDMQLSSAGDFTQTVGGKHTTTVTHGDYAHTTGDTVTLAAKNAVHLVSGQSRISVTSSDIIVEADKIEMGKGSGSASNINSIHSATANSAANAATTEVISHQQPTKAQQQKPVKYDYYVVTYDGVKMKIADSIEDDIVDFVADFQLGDYFETARWEEETQTTSVSREVEGEMRRSMIRRAGAAVGIYALNESQVIAHKKILIRMLNNLKPNIESKMPSKGGILARTSYQVSFSDTGTSLLDGNTKIIGEGAQYKPMIKKFMTGPSAQPTPRKGYHWEYLFVWILPRKN
jgi:type VI secretion system VgrG family protein